MDIKELVSKLTLEEKASLLTGTDSMSTAAVERLGIRSRKFADGPHGVRAPELDKYTAFPNLCCMGASWDTDMLRKMGETLADECISGGISMLLAPGINIKRYPLCGRNFEYLAEDPLLAGELAAAYINGIQSKGVGTSLKHYALNNQEKYREEISVEADMRALMEIYLKAFEIAVKKSSPTSVMCAYNKIYSIWCSENRWLLTDVLRDMWGYRGFVVSDWGAVHDIAKALMAGLDLQMPENPNIVSEIKAALEKGGLTEKDIDRAVEKLLEFICGEEKAILPVDREKHHGIARELAASGIVLLENRGDVLPITKEKYNKIAVVGGYAADPLINGQGSAEVNITERYLDIPLDEIKNIIGEDIEIKYWDIYGKSAFSEVMLWPLFGKFEEFVKDSDAVVFFIGSMTSEDTENFDRRSAYFNENYEMFVKNAIKLGKKVILVIQSGGVMILGDWLKKADAIVEMWLGGEGSGRAIADVLTGKINPSGKLPETFPSCMPTHLNYPGDGVRIQYAEGLDVGYRYYDRHPDEVLYPFGHGLSYTKFEYSNIKLEMFENDIKITADIKNIGAVYGGEVVQLYTSKRGGTVYSPIKELRAFKKVFLNPNETASVEFTVDQSALAYYNCLLSEWIVESAEYTFMLASSASDIRLSKTVHIDGNAPYTFGVESQSMIG